MSNNQNQAAQAATQGASIEAECRIAAGLKGLAAHVRAVSHYKLLLGDMEIVDQAIAAFECRTARCTPAAPAGAGELPPLPKQGGAHALAIAAKFDLVYDKEKGVHHYHGFIENLEGLIERAIAVDRAQQAGVAPRVKTWNQRILELETIPNNKQMPLETMRAMAAEIDDLRNEVTNLRAQLDNAHIEITTMRNDITPLKERAAARLKQIADLRGQLVHSEESVAQYQQNVQELAEELRAARAQLASK